MSATLTQDCERITFNLSGPARREKLEGRVCLVVPTVMIVEGVLNGSQGPLLYRSEDLADTPQLWAHKPIVLYHPQSGSASQARILNQQKVGVLLEVKWQAPKLRGEAWLDVERCNALDRRIIANLEAGKPLEVSTGLFTVNEPEEGTWNGKPYIAVATRHQPDHLAILPDAIGACSIADGAGLGVWNSVNTSPAAPADLLSFVQTASVDWPANVRKAVVDVLTHNVSGHKSLVQRICNDRRNTLKPEWLESQPKTILEKIVMINNRVTNQSSSPRYQDDDYEEEDLPLPTMNFSPPGSEAREQELNDDCEDGETDMFGNEIWEFPDPSTRR
jgi:hypothetical protein